MCLLAMKGVAQLAAHWNIPIFGWVSQSEEFEDKSIYSTLVRFLGPLHRFREYHQTPPLRNMICIPYLGLFFIQHCRRLCCNKSNHLKHSHSLCIFISAFITYFFYLFNYFLWLRITDEGSIPEIRIWSIL